MNRSQISWKDKEPQNIFVVIQLFKKDMDQLETWLSYREVALQDEELGDSIDAVEDLLRKHEDFEKTVDAQGDKFNAIKRLTLVRQCILES